MLKLLVAVPLVIAVFMHSAAARYSGRAKKIIFLRHGVTEMNEYLSSQPWGSVGFKDPELWDTKLSIRGRMEAEQLNNQLNNRLSRCFDIDTRNIELLVSSPLRRALHTADLVFSGMLNEVPRVVQSDARERLYLSSDVGSMKNELVVAFPQWDYSSLSDYAWWFTGPEFGVPYVEWRPPGKYACLGEPDSVFRTRIKALKSWLLNRPEQTILLVSHWGVIRALTGWSLSNCEIRACAADLLLQEAYIDP